MLTLPRPFAHGALLAALVLATACSHDDATPVANAAPPAAPAKIEAPHPPQLPRCADEHYLAAARALDAGSLAQAKQAWLSLPDGLDANLLGARIRALEGDGVGAVRAIEAARASWPTQSRVFATAAEIHAAAGRKESAEQEIRAGLEVAGPTPELSRARGVLALAREGGARVGLEHLLEARNAAPELEFTAQPLARAHVLLSRAALQDKQGADALAHARAAVAALPNDRDARQTLAEALAGVGQFDESIALYEALLAEGAKLETDFSWVVLHGATAALVESKRELAIERYRRALQLGLPREELGFGVTVLTEAATKKVDAGLAAYDTGELPAARAAFEAALALDPDSLEAHNHLAVVLFRQNEFAPAADHWQRVLALAHERQIELPEPVHLNLARALHQAGRSKEIRALLDEYLEREPTGEWADQTRDMLAKIELEQREQH